MVLDEAAEIDGAGKWKIFLKVSLPMAKGAIILSMLFSFVFYWNETYLGNTLWGGKIQTLPFETAEFYIAV